MGGCYLQSSRNILFFKMRLNQKTRGGGARMLPDWEPEYGLVDDYSLLPRAVKESRPYLSEERLCSSKHL